MKPSNVSGAAPTRYPKGSDQPNPFFVWHEGQDDHIDAAIHIASRQFGAKDRIRSERHRPQWRRLLFAVAESNRIFG
jgi:hypothetical protein